jgi:hypothetical protein
LRFDWLKSSLAEEFVNTYFWAWPMCETVHFIGLALLFGTVGLFDLRLLGMMKGLPVAAVRRLLPWGVFGFVLCLITGLIFLTGSTFVHPLAALRISSVQWKLLFIFLAGINVLVFYLMGLSGAVDALGPGDDARLPAKVVAATSLFLWIGVMFFGRMIPFSEFFPPVFPGL